MTESGESTESGELILGRSGRKRKRNLDQSPEIYPPLSNYRERKYPKKLKKKTEDEDLVAPNEHFMKKPA